MCIEYGVAVDWKRGKTQTNNSSSGGRIRFDFSMFDNWNFKHAANGTQQNIDGINFLIPLSVESRIQKTTLFQDDITQPVFGTILVIKCFKNRCNRDDAVSFKKA
jgi:hypothetical protein